MRNKRIEACIEAQNHSEIKCEEKQSKFILLNPDRKKIDKIVVDGCIYKKGGSELRCDYALNYADITIFVELKGTDIKRAIDQILATYEDAKFKINSRKFAVIVTSKTTVDSTKVKQQKNKLMNKHKIKLTQSNSPYEMQLSYFENK